ncbi:hypothetical protein ACP4OV_026707 [Aristida adscensionis]
MMSTAPRIPDLLSRKRKNLDDSPRPARSAGELDARLRENSWLMLILFETSTGFAIFGHSAYMLYKPNAIEDIWAQFGRVSRHDVVKLHEIKDFEDKSSAIMVDTGVNDELSSMILRWHKSNQLFWLLESLSIKESSKQKWSGIECVCDQNVMEVMWGLNNIMPSLIGEEERQLTKDDRLLKSQGLKMFLDRHGFDVKPELVNDNIVEKACALNDCDVIKREASLTLRGRCASRLKDISGINSDNWNLLKLATAVKMIYYPEEDIVYGDPQAIFSREELSMLKAEAPKHKRQTLLYDCN